MSDAERRASLVPSSPSRLLLMSYAGMSLRHVPTGESGVGPPGTAESKREPGRERVRARPEPSPPVECDWVELRDRDAVAVSDDFAARDLGLVRDHRLELLVADPRRDD